MLRDVFKKIRINKYVEAEESVVKEEILSVFIYPASGSIDVIIRSFGVEEQRLSEKNISISGDNYNLLYSDDLIFGPEKQAGSYREKDLWEVIDRVIGEKEEKGL